MQQASTSEGFEYRTVGKSQTIDLFPYDVTFVNKYKSRCILGSNGGIRRHIVVDKRSIVWWINDTGNFVTYDVDLYNISVKRKQEGHDGPVSLHWLIREIHSYQTLHYLGIGLKHKTPYKD